MLSRLLKAFGFKKDKKNLQHPSFKANKKSPPLFSPQEKTDTFHFLAYEKQEKQFNTKEFVERLAILIKEQNTSSTKNHCLQALEVAASLSQYQTEENKVSLIKGLISFKEAMMTIRAIRWRDGLFCPHCGQKNIQIISIDHDKYQYKCLDCEKDDTQGRRSLFDDLTGVNLPTDISSVIQWVLCIYLQIFLSTGKISKYLGVDPEYALHLIHMINVDSKINENSLKNHEGVKKSSS